jgi:3,4-dihydroxy 2-butanone 4-phosphate synthase/GTP cyclohydrolase II
MVRTLPAHSLPEASPLHRAGRPWTIAPIADAIEDIAAGKMVILVDDEDRENEGDLVIAADKVTPESIAFMAEHGRGLICLALDGPLIERLELTPMAPQNETRLGTAFTISIDAADCQGSGISARNRAHTIRKAIEPGVTALDFAVPGHVFPLRARTGGVLVRAGQTEGSVDLARLAGLNPAGVICEVMEPDGTMARLPSLLELGARYDIKVVTVADLIQHRLQSEPLVIRDAESELSTDYGMFRIAIYRSLVDGGTHAALVYGQIGPDPTLVRVHRGNLLSDAFGFTLSSGRRNLASAMEFIAHEGSGVVLYLDVDRDGAALARVLQDYVARSAGGPWPPVESRNVGMDFKEFGVGAQILRDLGLHKLRVMTNQPMRLRGVSGYGLEIVEWLPIAPRTAPVQGEA